MEGIVVACVLLVGGMLALAFRRRAAPFDPLREGLRVTPRVMIREVVPGTAVKIAGRVVDGQPPLVAPLSARSCYAWEVCVERPSPSGWRRVVREGRAVDFLIDDGTGRALVAVSGATVSLVVDVEYPPFPAGVTHYAPNHPPAAEFLARHQDSLIGPMSFDGVRFREGVVMKGELVTVFGRASWEPDPDPNPSGAEQPYRDAPRRLVIQASSEIQLHYTDDPTAA